MGKLGTTRKHQFQSSFTTSKNGKAVCIICGQTALEHKDLKTQHTQAQVEHTALASLLASIAELCTIETKVKILCSSHSQANDICNQLVNVDPTLQPKIGIVGTHYHVTFRQTN